MPSKKNKNKSQKPTLGNTLAKKEGFFKRNIWYILAFFIPFALMYTCFAIMKVSPFGNNQILVTDLWHQYYPFLVDFQSKLKEGGSLLWTWKSGCGTNYLALMSYYLASPLNFLSVLVPTSFLREFLAIIVCAKIGFAGLFFSLFLKITFKIRDASITAFGIMYALCSFILGYYWNIIWLDTVALLPLVIAGTIALLKEGKFRLYVISLALSILANYYIGLFTCIFVLLVSIVYCIVEFKGIKNLFKRFFGMAGATVVSLAMSAMLTLPAFFALQNTHSADNTFPQNYAINIGDTADFSGTMQAVAKVIANSVAFVKPTTKEGLPNIYCGVVAIVLGLLFLTCKKIKLRERIACTLMLVFFIMSFIIRQLDFVWHGFHFPNMLPYRFSFLYSFVLIYMAFRAYMNIEHTKLWQILVTTGLFMAVVAIAYKNLNSDNCINSDVTTAIIATVFIAFLVIVWLLLFSFKIVPKKAFSIALLIICVAEAACSTYIGTQTVTVTDGSYYPLGTPGTEKVVANMKQKEASTKDLYRAEVIKYYTLNDNALVGYNGISMFNSMTNSTVTRYMERFGICGWVASNRYSYQESSPVTNMFLNLKYLISPYGIHLDNTHMALVSQSGAVKLLKNKYYIPQGFMVSEDLLNYDIDTTSDNPFENQNKFFRLATGLDGDVYEQLEVVSQGHTDYEKLAVSKCGYGFYSYTLNDTSESNPHLKFNYTAPHDGTAYAYMQSGESENTDLMVNDNTKVTNYTKRPYIMQIGDVKEGDKLSVYNTLKNVTTGSCHVYCNMLNEELFQQGFEKLSESVLNATEVTDSKIEGTIDVKEDGLFYTSIAYDDGWSAYVDGEEVELTPICDALVAFKLGAGHHEIKLSYMPKGFIPGVCITLAAIAVFIAAIVLSTKKDLIFKRSKAASSEEKKDNSAE